MRPAALPIISFISVLMIRKMTRLAVPDMVRLALQQPAHFRTRLANAEQPGFIIDKSIVWLRR